MSDSNRSPIGGTFEDIGEAVVKPVVDEVGKMVEMGVSATKQNPTPQADQNQNPAPDPSQTQAQDQQKINEARWVINQNKKLEDELKKVREENKQKEMQRLQGDSEEKKIKQFEIVKKEKKDQALAMQQRKTEIRGGVGG